MVKKWIIGSLIGLVMLFSVLEIVRRSMAEEEQPPASVTAVDESQYSDESGTVYGETDPSTDQEFDRANEILDSREEDLNEAKRKVNIIVDNIKQ